MGKLTISTGPLLIAMSNCQRVSWDTTPTPVVTPYLLQYQVLRKCFNIALKSSPMAAKIGNQVRDKLGKSMNISSLKVKLKEFPHPNVGLPGLPVSKQGTFLSM